MKIQIKADSHNITIPIPTGLIFNRPMVWLWLKFVRKVSNQTSEYIPEHTTDNANNFLLNISDEAMYAVSDEIRRVKRIHGSWELVNVESSDGEKVIVTL